MPALVDSFNAHVISLFEDVDQEIRALRDVLPFRVVVLHVYQVLNLTLFGTTLEVRSSKCMIVFRFRRRRTRVHLLHEMLVEVVSRLQCNLPAALLLTEVIFKELRYQVFCFEELQCFILANADAHDRLGALGL